MYTSNFHILFVLLFFSLTVRGRYPQILCRISILPPSSAKEFFSVVVLSLGWLFLICLPTENPLHWQQNSRKGIKQNKQQQQSLIIFLNLANLLLPEQHYGLAIALSFNLCSYYFVVFFFFLFSIKYFCESYLLFKETTWYMSYTGVYFP